MDSAFGKRMLETQKPGSGGNRRSFGVPRNYGARYGRVDENDLAQSERWSQRAECDFLTDIGGTFTQDRRPRQVEIRGSIFQFDADLPAWQMIGRFRGVFGDRCIFGHQRRNNLEIR